MRKPILQVVFAVLISLIVIAGLYTNVLGASNHVITRGVQARANLGVMYQQWSPVQDGDHGGCHQDQQPVPDD